MADDTAFSSTFSVLEQMGLELTLECAQSKISR